MQEAKFDMSMFGFNFLRCKFGGTVLGSAVGRNKHPMFYNVLHLPTSRHPNYPISNAKAPKTSRSSIYTNQKKQINHQTKHPLQKRSKALVFQHLHQLRNAGHTRGALQVGYHRLGRSQDQLVLVCTVLERRCVGACFGFADQLQFVSCSLTA